MPDWISKNKTFTCVTVIVLLGISVCWLLLPGSPIAGAAAGNESEVGLRYQTLAQGQNAATYRIPVSQFWKTLVMFSLFCGYLVFSAGYLLFRWFGAGGALWNLFAALVLLEGIQVFLLNSPQLLKVSPEKLQQHIKSLYMAVDRLIIQFDPDCAQYDPGLMYLLKPGTCILSNKEFENEYEVNALGVRDDDVSLASPEIVVVGDSHAMGWGVDQEETFVQLIERAMNTPVLNASMSSFGTVREMILLSRVDTRNLKYLIVQYNEGDHAENSHFARFGNRIGIGPRSTYEQTARAHRGDKTYFPGKYTFLTVKDLFSRGLVLVNLHLGTSKVVQARSVSDQEEVRLFLNALSHAGTSDLSEVEVIVFEIAARGANDDLFASQLEKELATNEYDGLFKSVRVLDLSALLHEEDHYYFMDDHMNAEGHKIVAEAVFKMVAPTHPQPAPVGN